MATTAAPTVAETIRSQIGWGVLASLGASDFTATDASLVFCARILSMRADGTRSTRVRKMRVEVTLNGYDYYDVKVTYGSGTRTAAIRTHYDSTATVGALGVDFQDLPYLLMALDYDGDEVLNPRYWPQG